MAYRFCDCWVPLAVDQRSFTMLSFIWDDDVIRLSDWSLIVGLEILPTLTRKVCANASCILSPPFSVTLVHVTAVFVYMIQKASWWHYEKSQRFPGITHTSTEKSSVLCGIGWHISWQTQRERESHWLAKLKWKRGSRQKRRHNNCLTSVQCLPSVFSFIHFSVL